VNLPVRCATAITMTQSQLDLTSTFAGDEIVCLLSGDVTMVLDRKGVEGPFTSAIQAHL
jgi:hypothetical protein